MIINRQGKYFESGKEDIMIKLSGKKNKNDPEPFKMYTEERVDIFWVEI